MQPCGFCNFLGGLEEAAQEAPPFLDNIADKKFFS